jgi:hypothetical protein
MDYMLEQSNWKWILAKTNKQMNAETKKQGILVVGRKIGRSHWENEREKNGTLIVTYQLFVQVQWAIQSMVLMFRPFVVDTQSKMPRVVEAIIRLIEDVVDADESMAVVTTTIHPGSEDSSTVSVVDAMLSLLFVTPWLIFETAQHSTAQHSTAKFHFTIVTHTGDTHRPSRNWKTTSFFTLQF